MDKTLWKTSQKGIKYALYKVDVGSFYRTNHRRPKVLLWLYIFDWKVYQFMIETSLGF